MWYSSRYYIVYCLCTYLYVCLSISVSICSILCVSCLPLLIIIFSWYAWIESFLNSIYKYFNIGHELICVCWYSRMRASSKMCTRMKDWVSGWLYFDIRKEHCEVTKLNFMNHSSIFPYTTYILNFCDSIFSLVFSFEYIHITYNFRINTFIHCDFGSVFDVT